MTKIHDYKTKLKSIVVQSGTRLNKYISLICAYNMGKLIRNFRSQMYISLHVCI